MKNPSRKKLVVLGLAGVYALGLVSTRMPLNATMQHALADVGLGAAPAPADAPVADALAPVRANAQAAANC